MVDFRKLISPKTRNEIRLVDEAVTNFMALDNKAMASALVGMSRGLADTGLFEDERYSYDEWALYRVIPELARRLDPELELLPREIPKPEEAADKVTWLDGMTDAAFVGCIKSVLANASFRRADTGGFNPDFEMLRRPGRLGNPIMIAAARAFPDLVQLEEVKPDHRLPLPGFYVIASRGHHDQVLRYVENRSMAEMIFDLAVAVHADPESEEVERLVADIDRHDASYRDLVAGLRDKYRYWKGEVDGFSLQSFDGEVLGSARPAAPSPALSM